jgi:hypothetical protein
MAVEEKRKEKNGNLDSVSNFGRESEAVGGERAELSKGRMMEARMIGVGDRRQLWRRCCCQRIVLSAAAGRQKETAGSRMGLRAALEQTWHILNEPSGAAQKCGHLVVALRWLSLTCAPEYWIASHFRPSCISRTRRGKPHEASRYCTITYAEGAVLHIGTLLM